jgi:hypothetical protein
MARNEIDVDAPPEAVFGVLADPRSFARWVVGSRKIRAADPAWPEDGTAFDHAVGIGLLSLGDTTSVRHSEPPHRLELLVRARPFTRAVVTLDIRARDGGSHIVMDERPADLRSRLFFNPLTAPLTKLRNQESLRRLRRLAEGEEAIPSGRLPRRGEPAEASVKGSSRPV